MEQLRQLHVPTPKIQPRLPANHENWDYEERKIDVNNPIDGFEAHILDESNTGIGTRTGVLSADTLNKMKIVTPTITLHQTAGIIQGGSDCVDKFSKAFEDAISAAYWHWSRVKLPSGVERRNDESVSALFGDLLHAVKILIFVDDVVITFHPDFNLHWAEELIETIKDFVGVLGLKLGHGTTKDGVLRNGPTQVRMDAPGL